MSAPALAGDEPEPIVAALVGSQRRSARERSRRARTDAALVRDARRGSAEAWSTLFDRHWPIVYRAAFLVVHDGAAAEDIAQDAFIAALAALHRFDRRRPLGPWLHRIAVNRAIDHARSATRRREIASERSQDTAAAEVAPTDGTLVAAVAALSPDQRAVVVMRYLLDLTPGEIAAALGLPRGTVNSRLRRALDRLGDELGEELR